MTKRFLITGATGHVGTVLVSELLDRKEPVRVLVRPGCGGHIPPGVEIVQGDVTDPKSLPAFFERKEGETLTLVHCAARVTIASKEDPLVWETNVRGTDAVMQEALRAGVERVIYVSSVHAIPERPVPEVITEVSRFSPDEVSGQYAKSKAAATQLVLDYAAKGLNVSVVHPSGIIGPGDREHRNHMVRSVLAMAKGLIPAGLPGGYDFVDSRDVVQGILACEKEGRPGECYILNGHYITVSDLLNMVRRIRGLPPVRAEVPAAAAKAAVAAAEKLGILLLKKPPIFTPYALETLGTNGRFSHQKASREFGYAPRRLEDSVRDTLFEPGNLKGGFHAE